tara:strand:- start:436 stop:651 length:216 start_codon:yes stop_codon:yes gene_type:complete
MAAINNVKQGLKCHICHVPSIFILRLGHRSIKTIIHADGKEKDDLSSGYSEDFPYCRNCFESVKEAVYNYD